MCNTDMTRTARKWLSVLDDVLDSREARDLVDPSTGGGGPRSGMCYIASSVAHELLKRHSVVKWVPVCCRGEWGTHWWLVHPMSGQHLDLTSDQYHLYTLQDIYRSRARRRQGFVPLRNGSTMSHKAMVLLRMVEEVYASRYGEEAEE